MLKSRMINYEMLIWGYLTQHLLPVDQRTNITDLKIHFLRMFLERGLRTIGISSMPKCRTREECVDYLLERIPTKLQGVLRYAALAMRTFDAAVSHNITLHSFVDICTIVRENVMHLGGITPFIEIICPQAQVTDADVAEMFLSACQNRGQAQMLNITSLTNHKTPTIDALVDHVNHEIYVTQQRIAALRVQDEEHKINHAERAAQLWVRHVRQTFTTGGMNEIGELVAGIVGQGDSSAIPLLEAIRNYANARRYLGERRFNTLIFWCAPEGSDVFNHFRQPGASHEVGEGRNWMKRFIWRIRGY